MSSSSPSKTIELRDGQFANEFQAELEQNQHLKTPNNALRKQLAGQSRQGNGPNAFDAEQEQVLMGSGIAGNAPIGHHLQGRLANNQFNLSYTSFFNQQNIIGDPVVKPFSLNTPN
jgi:hypothetical protein